jgi:hypothetical protein
MQDPGAAVPFGRADVSGGGLVFGGGVEWPMGDGTTLLLEALRYNVGRRVSTSGLTSDSNPQDFVEIPHVTVVRVGMMLRF